MYSLFGVYPIDPSHVIAPLLVAYYAFNRFDTPRTARSQTSRFQYWGSRLSYVASCLGLLLVLTWAIEKNPKLLELLLAGAANAVPDLGGVDIPLVAALIMTTLLPAFPGLREVDARILHLFHKIGAIPFGAVRWAQQMKDATFRISAPLMSDMLRFIDNTAALPERLNAELRLDPQSDRLRFKFTRNLALYVTISAVRGRARFADDYPEEMSAFDKRLMGFFAQAVGFFALAAQINRQQSESATETLRDASDRFHDLELQTYEDLRLMLARILLYSCRGEHEVATRLREIGFATRTPKTVSIPMNQLALDLIGVVIIFLCSTSLRPEGGRLDVALWIGMSVAINYCIAALFAVVPKQVWGFADIRSSNERPILAYLVSAVFTFMTILPISFALYHLRGILLTAPPRPFSQHCTWLLLPTIMALSLAFACDNCIRRKVEPAWLSWIEALGIGGIIASGGFLVVRLLEQSGVPHRGSLMIPIAIGAAMGALFGGTIPRWYRQMLWQAEASSPSGAFDTELPAAVGNETSMAGAI
jgi:putative flippase GtrA